MIPPAVAGLPLFMLPPSVSVDTSEDAADSMRSHAAAIRDRVYVFLREQGTTGATCEEVCDALRLEGNTCRPRLWELEGALRVHKSPDKRLTRSGRWARVYRVGSGR